MIDCGPPPNISGCNVSVDATSCGSEVMYEAQPGLILKGDATVTCSENGEWRGADGLPTCRGNYYSLQISKTIVYRLQIPYS